ncbi:MAG TPA: hypothetical protein VFJ84_02085 [Candidatus Saccharimonadales bacterium]|nr:hypothetical protein [Candidatus Saccharimonadales bacterium]
MAAIEEVREPEAQSGYVAPEVQSMPRISKEAAALVCELGYRVAFIYGDEVKVEPLQEGVHRYPPVQVEVARDPDFIDRYIDMGPSTFSSLSNT